jgi:hypothetical protein
MACNELATHRKFQGFFGDIILQYERNAKYCCVFIRFQSSPYSESSFWIQHICVSVQIDALAFPALLYGSENWTTKARDARRITAAAMK